MPKPKKADAAPAAPMVDHFAANQEKVTKPGKSGALCSVGLKLPNGLSLRLQHQVVQPDPRRDGTMGTIQMWMPDYSKEEVILSGNAVPHGAQPKCLIVGGYAITTGISLDFMTAWMKQNKDLELVKNGLIIVHEKKSHLTGQANEQQSIKSGLEALVPDTDLRIPRKKKKNGKEERLVSSGYADGDDD